MRLRLLRLRFRRRLRKGQQQVEDFSQQAEDSIERHVFRRVDRLSSVRRFVAGWLLLVGIIIIGLFYQNFNLANYFQTLHAVPGGIYNEGVQGAFTNANPLYATRDVDTTVSHLIFASLFQYDDQNQLVGDLASGYTADDKGSVYTVKLKPNLKWQDGKPLTSADVLFTYQAIQNPDAQSPLRGAWQGVTITAPDAQTIVFTLPGPLASFPYSMTNGIVPQHLLAKLPATELRSADFNTVHPIGAGPFKWNDVAVSGNDPATQQEQIGLVPFTDYVGGSPKLQQFNVHAFASRAKLIQAFKSGQLTGVAGLDSIPNQLQKSSQLQTHSLTLTAANMVFFNNSSPLLSDAKLRQALVQGSDVSQITNHLSYTTHTVREPLLRGQLAYDPHYQQLGFDIAGAKATLDADGWVVGTDGIRAKAGTRLKIALKVGDTQEDYMIITQLQEQWRKIGVVLTPLVLSSTELQNSLNNHDYDAVLYGISIGVDPDVFAYWDSSQADVRAASRTNLSEYKNATADVSLEAGRTRISPILRTIKYRPFLQVWQQDNPALGLYQPRYLYLTNGMVAGLTDHTVNTGIDRFDNVQNWEIRQTRVTN